MRKLLIASIAAAFLLGCGGDVSTRPCQKPAYCYKTKDEPSRRKCDIDRAVAEEKAKRAEEEGNLSTRLYEDCWDF